MTIRASAQVVGRVRFWDRAASEQTPNTDPDATVGLLLSKDAAGTYYVEHVARMFCTPGAVTQKMVSTAAADGKQTTVAFHQDPASAGKMEAEHTAKALDGYNVRFAPATGNKEVRAKPVSAQCEAGNVRLVRGTWNDDFLHELEGFPVAKHDDQVDALSGAHGMLSTRTDGVWTAADIAACVAISAHDKLPTDFAWPEPEFPDMADLEVNL